MLRAHALPIRQAALAFTPSMYKPSAPTIKEAMPR